MVIEERFGEDVRWDIIFVRLRWQHGGGLWSVEAGIIVVPPHAHACANASVRESSSTLFGEATLPVTLPTEPTPPLDTIKEAWPMIDSIGGILIIIVAIPVPGPSSVVGGCMRCFFNGEASMAIAVAAGTGGDTAIIVADGGMGPGK